MYRFCAEFLFVCKAWLRAHIEICGLELSDQGKTKEAARELRQSKAAFK